MFENCAADPLGQATGCAAPSRHAEPGGHSVQFSPPANGWYVPAGERWHVALSRLAANVPGEQAVAAAEPALQA
eukprot:6058220-Prymnesium_polylepis.1